MMKKRSRVKKEEAPVAPIRIRVTGRGLRPDPRHGDVMVTKFVNCMMHSGNKSIALKIFYDAMEIIEKKSGAKGIEVFTSGVNNVKPIIEVRSKRVGGATWQVPVEVNKRRAQSLAIRWLLDACRSKKGRPMAERLASELMDAHKKEGAAITKRENTHKMAEANKAFAHFAW